MTQLRAGDCLDPASGLASLDTASVSALVTDPPAGIGFMGKEWDSDKGGRQSWVAWMTDVMRECLRVMKPGAHGVVWALPRTSHWTATALEDAGFELRDVVTHHFGTGFPKSLDVSKAIDKAAGAEREVIGQGPYAARRPRADKTAMGAVFADDAYVRPPGQAVTAPATDAAKQWQGWGTALKPASEHWILVRKPLIGTVAQNVQAHGTGALNIDGCRVATTDSLGGGRLAGPTPVGEGWDRPWMHDDQSRDDYAKQTAEKVAHAQNLGRWPANLVLSHSDDCGETCTNGCPVRDLDGQSSPRMHSAGVARGAKREADGAGLFGIAGGDGHRFGDSGGASRFFYCAKPSRAERGNDNAHPTVKAIALMSWLLRLIAPPGGLVLDPFAGSGTTAIACVRGGWPFIGWEKEPAYYEIAARRVTNERTRHDRPRT